MPDLLPWPSDSIVMVCAFPATAHRNKMESVNPGHCRRCGSDIVYDGRTIRRAMEIEAEIGAGRPARQITFFCEPCSKLYDVNACDRIVDHSGGKDAEYERR